MVGLRPSTSTFGNPATRANNVLAISPSLIKSLYVLSVVQVLRQPLSPTIRAVVRYTHEFRTSTTHRHVSRLPHLMAPRVPLVLKEQAISLAVVQKKTPREIADILTIPLATVYTVLRNYCDHSTVSVRSPRLPGRKRVLTPEDLQYIRNLMDANPCLYLDEIQSRLAQFDCAVSISTISRTIKRLGLSHKQARHEASEIPRGMRK